MPETIKEIYHNVENIFYSIANAFIGTSFNNSTILNIQYQFNCALIAAYPYYKFNPEITFNEYSRTINLKLNPNFSSFPKISFTNYKTHDFMEIPTDIDTYELYQILECKKCKLRISSSGTLLDGDLSCNEFIIKNLIE